MPTATDDRGYWISVLDRIARPVLTALAQRRLKRDMPIESSGRQRELFTHLEAIGRLLAGIAPWLACRGLDSNEAALQRELRTMTLDALRSIVDPDSPDRIDFGAGPQVVVDTAFLAQGLLRDAGLWAKLDDVTRSRLVAAMVTTRRFTPPFNNWLLFSATTEVMLRQAGADWDRMRVDYALRQHEQWYKGDGSYGDGPAYHWDYYNAFVIQPMLLDVLDRVAEVHDTWRVMRPRVTTRARRYAAVQERMISPEGTFPPIGRSLAYRYGALQVLGQMAWRRDLPEGVAPAQVRCAMTAVIRRMTEASGTFDERGWLRVGFCGHQPAIGEPYISTGSLYLCAVGLLPLGLPPDDAFWRDTPLQWTSQRAWASVDLPTDHALHE
jgi:hypothetical protein